MSTYTGDLVTFVRRCLDEDEAWARAIDDRSNPWPGQWVLRSGALYTRNGWCLATAPSARGQLDEGVGQHIARHDPARVLAEVAAKRRLLDAILEYESKIDGEWGCCHGPEAIAAGECQPNPASIPALLFLAAPYAGLPGWRDEWKVTE